MTQQQSIITLLRHGEPIASHEKKTSEVGQIFRGITDDVLSEQGWKQMENAVTGLHDIDLIVTSPLKRCADFALKLSETLSLPLQQQDAFKEINFGQWDGKSVQQIELESSGLLKKFWQNPIENTPPDGEPVIEFQKRVVACWNEIITGNPGKNILIIAHGGVQKVILAQILEMPVHAVHNIEVPYACCSTINVYFSDSDYLSTLRNHG